MCLAAALPSVEGTGLSPPREKPPTVSMPRKSIVNPRRLVLVRPDGSLGSGFYIVTWPPATSIKPRGWSASDVRRSYGISPICSSRQVNMLRTASCGRVVWRGDSNPFAGCSVMMCSFSVSVRPSVVRERAGDSLLQERPGRCCRLSGQYVLTSSYVHMLSLLGNDDNARDAGRRDPSVDTNAVDRRRLNCTSDIIMDSRQSS